MQLSRLPELPKLYFFGRSWIGRARFTASGPLLAVIHSWALWFSLPAAVFAQNLTLSDSQPPGQALDETTIPVLQAARDRLIDSVKRAPRYTCTETIERETWGSPRETHSCETRAPADRLAAQDRLRLDVAVSDGGEIFSWHGEKQFSEGDIGDLVGSGMVGSGLFSAFLSGIFGDSHYIDRFRYIKTANADGEELAEFQFVMTPAASHWIMRTGPAHAIVGYHGSVWIEPKSSSLRHIHIVADALPPQLKTCSVEVDLRYHTIQLGSNEFVIPERAETVSTGPTALRSVSETRFLQCHEFLGESTLHFDSVDDAASPKAPVVTPQIKELPAGIHFSVDLETKLDVRESWVGDPIEGRLADNMRLSTEVIAPKGSRVVGRLVELQTYLRPDERLEVGFDWQQIEVAPATVLRLRADYIDLGKDVVAAAAGAHGHGRSRGGLVAQPAAVEGKPFVFALAGSHKKLAHNLNTNWVTVSLKKPAKTGLGAEPR